jgi:ribose 5-phosphate isomerase B
MKVAVASDHAGFILKSGILQLLEESGHQIIVDSGPSTLNDGDDYPPLVAAAAAAVSRGDAERAIVLGGSGTGEAVVANRFPGVRAAVYYGGPLDIIRLSREHNDANVLSLGARFVSEDEAAEAVKLWLETPFTAEERHVRRIAQIEEVTRS